MKRPPSPKEVTDAMTERGGWTKAQLAKWGVSWPPPKGWREQLEWDYRAWRKKNLALQRENRKNARRTS